MLTRTVSIAMVFGVALVFGGSDVRAVERAGGVDGLTISEGPALPAGRGNHAGGVVGGQVVIAGGTMWSADRKTKHWLSDALIFGDGKWSDAPPLPHAVSEPMFAYDDSGFYVAGGRRGAGETNDGVYRLSEVDGNLAWATLPKLPMTWTAGAGGIIDGRFVVTCGSVDNNAPTNQTWSLDLSGDGKATWKKRKPLPGPPRMYPAMAACGKFLYLFGGMRPTEEQGKPGMEVFKDAYRYDAKDDVWERLPDLPARGYCWAAAAIDDQAVLLTGRADGAIHDDVWRVNLSDMSVRNAGRLVIQSTCAPLVPVGANRWWLVGGEPDGLKTRTEKVTVIQSAGS